MKDQQYQITAGAGEYEGQLFYIENRRSSGCHRMCRVDFEWEKHIFPLSKPYFLNESNAVQPSLRLMRLLNDLIRQTTLDIHCWLKLGDEDPFMANITRWTYNGLEGIVPTREQLGVWAREGWVKWAQTLPNPKPDWIKPYDQLSDGMKEADMVMGQYIASKLEVFCRKDDS